MPQTIAVLKNSYTKLARNPKHSIKFFIKLVLSSSEAFQQEHVTPSENATGTFWGFSLILFFLS